MNDRQTNAFNNLLVFKNILFSLKVIFWVDGGTLLGFYREGNFPEDDEDDIDLGCWDNNLTKRQEIIDRCLEAGFSIYHTWEKQIAFKKDDLKIDLFFHGKHKNNAFHFLYKGNKGIPAIVPLKYFSLLKPFTLKGENFFIPRETESYLEFKYGDWKKPIHRKDYAKEGGCYNPLQNKVLKPNYIFD